MTESQPEHFVLTHPDTDATVTATKDTVDMYRSQGWQLPAPAPDPELLEQ